jgi:Fucose permease
MTAPSVPARLPLFTPARLAVSLMFLVNGFVVGSWAPKIPDFADRLSLSETALGVMIFFLGVGSLTAMPLVGATISRRGARPPLLLLAALTAVSLLPVTFAPGVVTAAIALFLFGAFLGGQDVAMNANAVEVEKREGRAIMSSCHGFWSLGGVLGSTLGGLMIGTAGVTAHAIAATLFAIVMVVLAWPRIIIDVPRRHDPETGAAMPPGSVFRAGLTVWLIGFMCLFSMMPEGATLDWSALYLRNELGADATMSAFAFAAFSATMAVMRFLGDGIRDRFGAVRTLRVSGVFAIIGLLIAAFAPSPLIAALGFGISGLGFANMVPICFSAAGNLPGLAPGVAISLVTFMGYSGILFAPSVIGFIAEHTGFSAVFAGLPVLLAFVLVMSNLVRYAETR